MDESPWWTQTSPTEPSLRTPLPAPVQRHVPKSKRCQCCGWVWRRVVDPISILPRSASRCQLIIIKALGVSWLESRSIGLFRPLRVQVDGSILWGVCVRSDPDHHFLSHPMSMLSIRQNCKELHISMWTWAKQKEKKKKNGKSPSPPLRDP